MAVGAAGLAAATLVWQSLRTVERSHIVFMAEAQARSAARDLEGVMPGYVESFTGIVQRAGAALRQKGRWQIGIKGLKATLWVEPSGKVGWVTPLEGNQDLIDADLCASDADRSALLKAGSSGQPSVTSSVALPQGDASFHLVVPVSEGDRLEGFLVGVFSAHTLYPVVLRPDSVAGWALAVFESDRELYRQGSPVDSRWLAESKVTMLDAERRLRVGPTPETLARLQSPLPSVVLAAGSLIALLLAASVGLAQSARRRARQVEGAQAGLANSEHRLRAILDGALDAVIAMDAQGLVVSWNARAAVMFGWAREEAVGRRLSDLIIPLRYREAHTSGLARFIATGEGPVIGRRIEISALRRDGSELPVELTVTALKEGDAPLFNAFVVDITERKRGEQRVAAQHAATRILAEASTLAEAAPKLLRTVGEALGYAVGALWTVDRAGGVMRCGDVWRSAGEAAPEFAALTRKVVFAPGVGLPGRVWLSGEAAWIPDVSTDPNLPRRAVAEGLRSAFAFPIRFLGEVVAVAELFSRDTREPDPELLKIMANVGSQIEHFWQRRRAEKALQAAQERLAHVVSWSPAVLYSLKVEGQELVPTWVSENIEALIGYKPEDIRGAGWWVENLHPEDRERVVGQIPTLLSEGYVAREYRFRHKDGTYRWVADEQRLLRDPAGSPLEVVGSWSNVTEKKRLEAQLFQAQKMESVGRLAGGVAHDFNNLLGVIAGYGELLGKRLPDDPRLKKYLGDIMKAGERAAGLTRQLLAFSRRQVLQPRILDLNAVVGEMERMLQRLIGEDIQLATVLEGKLGRARADPGQIEQVLMNLAVNARDAMPRGGRLTLETANVDLDVTYARSRPGVEPGPHVMLAVSDTGHGIPPEVLDHIFEPFFTTKEEGKGTGLGLATVHGIVKQSGGHIFVYSEAEHGTTFKIYLPRLEEAVTAMEATPPVEAELPRGSETILLVEDEASLRSLVRECLEVSGYTVVEARHAAHALEIAEVHPAPLHLLMTDVVMPGMSGRELAERLAASHAETRVLYMSGYTDDAVVLHGVLAADVAFLQKPFTTDALARAVREVLDR